MTVRFSEMCAVRTDLASRVEAAFSNYLEDIAQGYGAYLAPELADGETAPDLHFQLVLLSRRIRHHRQRIERLDEDVLAQVQGDEKVRAEIARRTDALDRKLRQVRSAYRGFYGLDNLARVGLAGDFHRGTLRLHRQAVTIKTSLESPDLILEPLLDLDLGDGESPNLATQLAAQLEPELTRLGELLDERHQNYTRTTDVRLQRQEVIRDFDFHIRGIVRMAQGMFRLAGRNDLGTRIRPILRRVLRRLDDQEAKESTDADSGAGTDAGTATDAGAVTNGGADDSSPPTDSEPGVASANDEPESSDIAA